MSTKEQIEEAKIDIKNVVRLSLGVVPLDDALALLSALEAAEQDLAEYKRKAMEYSEDSCSGCTATMALRERAEVAEQERDDGEKMSQALKEALLKSESRIKELEAAERERSKWKNLAEKTEIKIERLVASGRGKEDAILRSV